MDLASKYSSAAALIMLQILQETYAHVRDIAQTFLIPRQQNRFQYLTSEYLLRLLLPVQVAQKADHLQMPSTKSTLPQLC